MSEKKRSTRSILSSSDCIIMAEVLSSLMESFGQLILALMQYASTGKEPDDLPLELRTMSAICQEKIDTARRKHKRLTELEQAFDFCSSDGMATLKDLAENMRTTERAARNRIKEHGGFWISDRKIGRKEVTN